MTTYRQYFDQLRISSRGMSGKFGVDMRMGSRESRTILAVVGAALAAILKLLVDKGVVTDAEVQAAFQAAAGDTWDPEPDEPPAEPRNGA